MIDEAERLTRDVLLTLSNGPFYSTTLFLEFPCVASALVHFSTLLSLCFYFFFLLLFFSSRFIYLVLFRSRRSTIEKSKLSLSEDRISSKSSAIRVQ